MSEDKIKSKLIFAGKYTVALLPDDALPKGRNIVGIDVKKNILWRIPSDDLRSEFPYTSITDKNGELYVFNFSGIQYHIDYKTGKVLSRRWLK